MHTTLIAGSSVVLRPAALLACLFLLAGASCQPRPQAPGPDGTHFVVRFEHPAGFLKVDSAGVSQGLSDADAAFVLFNLNGGELKAGSEVLLLSARDSYLKGGAPGDDVTVVSSGASAPGSGQIGFCNVALVIESESGGGGALADGAGVRLRMFPDPCGSPANRSPGGFVSVGAGGTPTLVAGPPGTAETFVLHIDRAEPYSILRNLSAPFATTNRFNAGNLMDLDWHNGTMRDYQGGNRTYDNHSGIDFGWDWPGFRAMEEGGAAVLAVAEGTVVYVRHDRIDRCHGGEPPGMGCPPDVVRDTDKKENEVILRHDDGTVSVYSHLMTNSVPVAEGARVACGQLIGRVGSSGGSSAPHLHFELRRPHDPDFWLKHPGSVQFPHFWDHSMAIDPYAIGAWQRFGQTAPWTGADRQRIPLVTCTNNSTRRLGREGESVFGRSRLAKGFEFDGCGDGRGCGVGFYCGSKGFCEYRVGAGDACTSGNQCPALHGCQNGVCRLGPNCSDRCPVFPHPDNCYVDAAGVCRRNAVREDCSTVGGVCVLPCFRDGAGACKIEGPGKGDTCAQRCLQ